VSTGAGERSAAGGVEWLYEYANWFEGWVHRHFRLAMVIMIVTILAGFRLPYGWVLIVSLLGLTALAGVGSWLDSLPDRGKRAGRR